MMTGELYLMVLDRDEVEIVRAMCEAQLAVADMAPRHRRKLGDAYDRISGMADECLRALEQGPTVTTTQEQQS